MAVVLPHDAVGKLDSNHIIHQYASLAIKCNSTLSHELPNGLCGEESGWYSYLRVCLATYLEIQGSALREAGFVTALRVFQPSQPANTFF